MSVSSSGKCVRYWFGTSTGPIGLAMITDRALYPYWEAMGWGFSLRIFQTFQVQVQAWKVAKHVVNRYGLRSLVVRVFRCVCLGELESYD
ncbi:hypothetical protein PIB30_059710 [Stylosanthes scabra]|uniref:Uncharacterized protein n=1 Tax=Stylosanthes scabra TaxID=79078 RepID=A0ABU6WK90_9FABA|nr:hypothetical protein [Stylosanthes scabra]